MGDCRAREPVYAGVSRLGRVTLPDGRPATRFGVPFGRPAPLGLLALLAGFDCCAVQQLPRSRLTVALSTLTASAIFSIVQPHRCPPGSGAPIGRSP
jgi:hypothetical protein